MTPPNASRSRRGRSSPASRRAAFINDLPSIDDATAQKLAERLSERADGEVTAEQVKAAGTIQDLSTVVRDLMDAGEVDGFVRTIRARPEGSTRIPVFVFHPAGGSTVVYEPLLKRLPPDTPMYGFERVEGSVEERAAEYLPKLAGDPGRRPLHPGRLVAGWRSGLRLRDRAQAVPAPTCASSG